ncbi:MAG: hypothetical protein WD875_17790 [Pirellulales bacterium]
MNRYDLAKAVLFEIECFWRLQEVDFLLDSEDVETIRLMDRLYRNRSVDWRELHPIMCLPTLLTHLALPVAYALSLSAEELSAFTVKSQHDVLYRKKGCENTAEPRTVIRVVRNALAHLPDFASNETSASPNVNYDEGTVRFWSRTGEEVVFKSQDGLVAFVNDLLRVVRAAVAVNTHPVLDRVAVEVESARTNDKAT